MAKIFAALAVGLIFGAGISISGMINPTKVLNFFDLAGDWDPSLAFVMGGALTVVVIGYRIVLNRSAPLLDEGFHLPEKTHVDAPLVTGAALFGIGWGIAGFCPGGSIPALGLFQTSALCFILAMISGIAVARLIQRSAGSPTITKASACG